MKLEFLALTAPKAFSNNILFCSWKNIRFLLLLFMFNFYAEHRKAEAANIRIKYPERVPVSNSVLLLSVKDVKDHDWES